MDLTNLIDQIQQNKLVPHLVQIQDKTNDKKPRLIAELIIKDMHKSINKPVPKDIYHDGKIHKVTYFDIEPLLKGVWGMVSLMLLNLSYSEQVIIIEAIYPKDTQLIAKAFAMTFTHAYTPQSVTFENTDEVTTKLDSANTGIAMILAVLKTMGGNLPHVDEVTRQKSNMTQVTDAGLMASKYGEQMIKKTQIDHFRDSLSK